MDDDRFFLFHSLPSLPFPLSLMCCTESLMLEIIPPRKISLSICIGGGRRTSHHYDFVANYNQSCLPVNQLYRLVVNQLCRHFAVPDFVYLVALVACCLHEQERDPPYSLMTGVDSVEDIGRTGHDVRVGT